MRFSASLSLMFQEYPLRDRFRAARAAGFLGVEIQRLEEGRPEELAGAAAEAGVEVVLVNVPGGDYTEGGPGLSGVPGREAEFREAVARTLDAARRLKATFVHLGPSRIPDGVTRAECLATYCANIEDALTLTATGRPRLLIEAMNRVEAPTALLNDVDAAAGLIRDRFAGLIGLQFDIYHAAMNGRDVLEAYRANRDLVEHIQFADAPGRHEPGTGTVAFGAIFAGIAGSGYAGWLGAEYRPSRRTDETLGWLRRLAGADAR